jgi:L-seryl-tRNA(Ser) seleniumtransferase
MQMILAAPEAIEARARALAARAEAGGALEAEVTAGRSKVGGGTTPGVDLPTFVLALRHRQRSVDWLDRWLRGREPGIVGRIEHDRLLLDLRTVLAGEDAILAEALAAVPA